MKSNNHRAGLDRRACPELHLPSAAVRKLHDESVSAALGQLRLSNIAFETRQYFLVLLVPDNDLAYLMRSAIDNLDPRPESHIRRGIQIAKDGTTLNGRDHGFGTRLSRNRDLNAIFERHAGPIDLSKVTERPSAQQNFLGITYVIRARSTEQIAELFEALKLCPQVLLVI